MEREERVERRETHKADETTRFISHPKQYNDEDKRGVAHTHDYQEEENVNYKGQIRRREDEHETSTLLNPHRRISFQSQYFR